MSVSRYEKNILITGVPGVGKTTLVRTLAEQLAEEHPVGFYTEEIRESGVRRGFDLVTFDGHRSMLSHVNIHSRHRVGKYRVDVTGFEAVLERLSIDASGREPVIVDEIGKMECFSGGFVALMRRLLDSRRPVIATVALKGSGFIAEVKRRPDMTLFTVTLMNRNSIARKILNHLHEGV